MKLELYINGKLHDTFRHNTGVTIGTNALKSKWWFLLKNNDWVIYQYKQSKMNTMKTEEEEPKGTQPEMF